jgi:hypothetical protein
MSKSEVDPTARLAELEAARDAARQVEQEARDEHSRRQRAVPEAREALTRAHAEGAGVKAAEEAYEKAQKAAGDGSLSAKLDGLARATRAAEQAAQAHRAAHLADLVEAVRPRAEAAVQAIHDRADALRDALDEYAEVGREIGRVSSGVQWFVLNQRVPWVPQVDKLRASIDPGRLDGIPTPMPTSTESPAAEAERLAREHESAQQAGRIVCRGCRKAIHPDAGSGVGYCVRCTARVPAAA